MPPYLNLLQDYRKNSWYTKRFLDVYTTYWGGNTHISIEITNEQYHALLRFRPIGRGQPQFRNFINFPYFQGPLSRVHEQKKPRCHLRLFVILMPTIAFVCIAEVVNTPEIIAKHEVVRENLVNVSFSFMFFKSSDFRYWSLLRTLNEEPGQSPRVCERNEGPVTNVPPQS